MFKTHADGQTFTFLKAGRPVKQKLLWVIGRSKHHDDGVFPWRSTELTDPSDPELLDAVRMNGIQADEIFQGVEMRVENVVTISDEKKKVILQFSWAFGPRAAEVNELLAASDHAKALARSIGRVQGIEEVEFLGVDQSRVVKPAQVSGLKIADRIVKAILDAGNEPMDAEEIMRRAQEIGGRPHVPGSGSMYFSPSGSDSLVAKGLLVRHGRGKSAKFTVKTAEKFDWRPDETIPEDYYAL